MPVLQSLNLHRHDRGDETTITLTGELDLDTVAPVRAMVDDCLREGVRTIDIDVSALAFCDVSGLNAFLAVAACTATARGSLCLLHPRPTLIRLLALTGTGFLLHRLPRAPEAGAWVPAVVYPKLLAS